MSCFQTDLLTCSMHGSLEQFHGVSRWHQHPYFDLSFVLCWNGSNHFGQKKQISHANLRKDWFSVALRFYRIKKQVWYQLSSVPSHKHQDVLRFLFNKLFYFFLRLEFKDITFVALKVVLYLGNLFNLLIQNFLKNLFSVTAQ